MEKSSSLLARLAVIAVSAGAMGLSAPAVASAAVSTEVSPQALDKAREAVATAAAEPAAASPDWIQVVWCKSFATSAKTESTNAENPNAVSEHLCPGPAFGELLS